MLRVAGMSPFLPLVGGAAASPGALPAALGAVVLGATTSLHCFAMCGPLACAAQTRVGPGSRVRRALAYHGARVAAYATVGGLLGAVGGALLAALPAGLPGTLARPWPWLLAAALLLSAIDPEAHWLRRLRPLPGIAHVLRRCAALRASLAPTTEAALLGALTPLLPCGLLYAGFAAAIATGWATGGAILLGGFALGAVPALAAAQLHVALARRSSAAFALARRAVPLVAAALLVYRAVATAHGSCCHR